MTVIVVTPPAPFLLPSDIPGSHAVDDPLVAAWIAAATGEIDGPDGWVGMAVGVQTLEYRLNGFPDGEIKLPCGPIISVTSVIYLDQDGVAVTLDGGEYELLQRDDILAPAFGKTWPSALNRTASVRILYVAGFNEVDVSDGGTGDISARIKQAGVLLTTMYKNAGVEDLSVSEVTVDGVGTTKFVVSEVAGKVYRDRVESLLMPMRRYW